MAAHIYNIEFISQNIIEFFSITKLEHKHTRQFLYSNIFNELLLNKQDRCII